MAEGDIFLTREGFEKIGEELKYLKSVKRPEISLALEKARELGDLKENAEYHAAKEAISFSETNEWGDESVKNHSSATLLSIASSHEHWL